MARRCRGGAGDDSRRSLAFARALELVLGQVDGTEVALARTLEEGRALIRNSGPFDVAVLDLTLPDGEGTELVAEIRQSRPETPVAVLSAMPPCRSGG